MSASRPYHSQTSSAATSGALPVLSSATASLLNENVCATRPTSSTSACSPSTGGLFYAFSPAVNLLCEETVEGWISSIYEADIPKSVEGLEIMLAGLSGER